MKTLMSLVAQISPFFVPDITKNCHLQPGFVCGDSRSQSVKLQNSLWGDFGFDNLELHFQSTEVASGSNFVIVSSDITRGLSFAAAVVCGGSRRQPEKLQISLRGASQPHYYPTIMTLTDWLIDILQTEWSLVPKCCQNLKLRVKFGGAGQERASIKLIEALGPYSRGELIVYDFLIAFVVTFIANSLIHCKPTDDKYLNAAKIQNSGSDRYCSFHFAHFIDFYL